jgi:uncharacterized protein DUF3467
MTAKKKELPKPAEITVPEPTFVMDPEFKNIYANFVVAQFTPFDISLSLGEAIGIDSQGKQLVNQKGRLTMAAQEAKIVMLILANTVRLYEQQFGELKIPTNLMPGFREGASPLAKAK